jgi:hypothetical protein
MSEIINLNKARKAMTKAAGKTQAARNRVAFGRPKEETALEKARREKAAKALDGKKLDD